MGSLGFRALISNSVSGGQCHITHLTILTRLSWSSLPTCAQKWPETSLISFYFVSFCFFWIPYSLFLPVYRSSAACQVGPTYSLRRPTYNLLVIEKQVYMMHTVMPHVKVNTTRPVKRGECNIKSMLA